MTLLDPEKLVISDMLRPILFLIHNRYNPLSSNNLQTFSPDTYRLHSPLTSLFYN